MKTSRISFTRNPIADIKYQENEILDSSSPIVIATGRSGSLLEKTQPDINYSTFEINQ